MGNSGIMRICVSVKNMAETLGFYIDTVGLKMVAEDELSEDVVKKLYKLSGTTAKSVMLKNDEQPTLLQLIEFNPNSGKYMRKGRPSTDFGYYDIAFRVKDNKNTFKNLTEKGYSYACPPYEYTADWVNVTVSEAVAISPNYVPMAMIERLSEPIPQFPGAFSIFTDVAQTVENAEEAITFYSDIIGLPKVFDAVLPRGLVDPVVGVPDGTDTRMIMFGKGNTPVVELLEYSIKGKTMADVAQPPNIGIFATAFATDSLDEFIQVINEKGRKIITGPVEIQLKPYGKIRTLMLEGPSKINVEVYERLE